MQSAWQPQFGTFTTTWAALNTPMMNNMIAPTGGQFVYTAGSQSVVPGIMLMPQQMIGTSTSPVVNLTEAGTLETLMDPGALNINVFNQGPQMATVGLARMSMVNGNLTAVPAPTTAVPLYGFMTASLP